MYATDYASFLPAECDWVREPAAEYQSGGRWTERHLQCVWYNDSLRPAALVTDDGEPVEVESCGRWNLEAGPDFLDAALLIGAERRRVVGDVEIHIRPSGWSQHRHASDPRYANVIAHVTYFPGPRGADLPPSVAAIPLRDALRASPRFSFDDIDLSAYPHAVIPASPRPCQLVWGDDPDRGGAILEAAGRHRLELKTRRMADLADALGDSMQALYESVMAALGYKQNAQPFRDLARAYPLAAWMGDRLTDYARLLGLAGLLPDASEADGNASFVRDLWDRWWRAPVRPAPSPPEWRLDAVRPLNHPVRRLAAAAALFSERGRFEALVVSVDPSDSKFVRKLCRALTDLARFAEVEPLMSLTGEPGRPTALLGASRAEAVAVNAILPFIAATRPETAPLLWRHLPPESVSAPMRTMANRLFGRDHNPSAIYAADGLRQQGLLQIFSDFCLNARGGCDGCRFGRQPGAGEIGDRR